MHGFAISAIAKAPATSAQTATSIGCVVPGVSIIKPNHKVRIPLASPPSEQADSLLPVPSLPIASKKLRIARRIW